MTRLNRWLLGLLLVQLVALCAVWLLPSGSPAEKPRKLLEGKLDVAAVTRIRIAGNDGKSVELKKKDAGWVLASGGDYPALGNKVSELLGKLPGLVAGSPVTGKPDHHRALEVAADTFQREVRIEQTGKPELHFYLGSSSGLKDVHFRLAGENAVYMVKDLSAWDAGTAPTDWVSAEYLKVERDAIVGLTIQNAEGQIELSKGEGGKWALTDLAEGTKLKDSEVESLLGAVSAVSLQEPVGTKLEAAQGLEKPAATVTILIKAEKKGEAKADKNEDKPVAVPAAKRLFIGAKAGDAYFAKSETSPYVVKLSSWTAETFLKKRKADLEEKEKKEGETKGEGGAEHQAEPVPGLGGPAGVEP